MAVLTANSEVPVLNVVGDLLTYKCGASVVIYKGGFVGIDPAGYAKPFVPGDRFVGIAYEAVTAAQATATAGTYPVRVYYAGVFQFDFAGAALDVGRCLYATNDGTVAKVGHPDAFIGRIVEYTNSTTVKIVLRNFGEYPGDGKGSILQALSNTAICQTRLTAGDIDVAGANTAILGGQFIGEVIGATTGTLSRRSAVDGGLSLAFGATAEVQTVSVYDPTATLLVSRGITFEVDLTVATEVDADAADGDLDWGLGTVLVAASQATIADAAMVDIAAYHYNSLATQDLNIYCGCDNNAVDTRITTDTLVNLAVGTYKNYKVIVRPDGAVEFWIDNARAVPTTITFPAGAVRTTALLAPFINWEKAANDSLGTVYIRNLRVGGSSLSPMPA